MASFDFESVKGKVVDTVNAIAGKSTGIAKNVAGKASAIGKKAKLSAEVAAEKEAMKKKYQELGRLYYEKYNQNIDPDFEQAADDIKISADKIEAKLAELAELNTVEEPEEVDPEAEVEDVEVEVTEEVPAPAEEEEKPEE